MVHRAEQKPGRWTRLWLPRPLGGKTLEDRTLDELGLDIGAYYAIAASIYDEQRFGSSYGCFLDPLERDALRRWLPASGRVLDVGCGTGRLLDLATDGIDRCEEMLTIARSKHPTHRVLRASATALPFDEGAFDAVFSMHVLMHLPKVEIARILGECHRVLRPGGRLVFDVPGQPRRNLTGFRPESWHCGTAFSPEELKCACPALSRCFLS